MDLFASPPVGGVGETLGVRGGRWTTDLSVSLSNAPAPIVPVSLKSKSVRQFYSLTFLLGFVSGLGRAQFPPLSGSIQNNETVKRNGKRTYHYSRVAIITGC